MVFGFLWSVIADNVLPIGESVFTNTQATGFEIVVGAAAYSVGVVADLAGLSALAVAVALLFGVELRIDNVERPYMALSPIEFWDRWNRSVTQWFLRRVAIPLERMSGSTQTALPVVVAFAAMFAWYVQSVSMLVWALLHLAAVSLQAVIRRARPPRPGAMRAAAKSIFTLGFVSYSWIWFGSGSLHRSLALHRDALSFELTSFAVGAGALTIAFFVLLVITDEVARIMIPTRAVAGRRSPLVDSGAVRGAIVGTLIAVTLVCSTPVVHRSVLGLS